MTPSEQLRAARALIDTPEKWCKGADARNDRGSKCGVTNPAACRWCSAGAMRAARAQSEAFCYLEAACGRAIEFANDYPATSPPSVNWPRRRRSARGRASRPRAIRAAESWSPWGTTSARTPRGGRCFTCRSTVGRNPKRDRTPPSSAPSPTRPTPFSTPPKREVLDRWRRPEDIPVIGYTAEEQDRADDFLDAHGSGEFPLIDAGQDKAACLAMIERSLKEDITTFMQGRHNCGLDGTANCPACQACKRLESLAARPGGEGEA